MYRQQSFKPEVNKAKCSECGSSRFRVGGGKVTCYDCNHAIVTGTSKYRNVRQTFQGYSYDSKLEADYAADLELRQKCGDIKSWERQYKIELRVNGKLITRYYCDFRVSHNDGTYELVELKGSPKTETESYRIKRKLLEAIWLPEHVDHTYIVVYGSLK